MGSLSKLKLIVGRKSRDKKLEHFYGLCRCGTILDAGVSYSAKGLNANRFLETFRYSDSDYVGLGINDLSGLKKRHPGKSFVRYSGGTFPFAEKAFDWVFSNAVVEHVGNRQRQLHFINEMLRVGHNVFFTTPNRYFPVESHTDAILLHWLPSDLFFQWCSKKQLRWSATNLNLLTRATLESLMKASTASEYTVYGNRFLGWPMTFTVVCKN